MKDLSTHPKCRAQVKIPTKSAFSTKYALLNDKPEIHGTSRVEGLDSTMQSLNCFPLEQARESPIENLMIFLDFEVTF